MIQAVLLALIAGYVDTIGYLHLNAFAGLMTGNTIFMGIELATSKYSQAASHAVIILMFLIGVVLGRLMIRMGAKVWLALTFTSILLVIRIPGEGFGLDSWAAVKRVGWLAMSRGGRPWRGLLVI